MTIEECHDTIMPLLRPYGFRRIAIYGSVARGEDGPGSDLDLLVEIDPDSEAGHLGLFQWVALEDELARRIGWKVEIVTREGMSPYILPFAEREAVFIHEV